MGASFQKIEAYLIFFSFFYLKQTFDNLEDDLKEISKLFSFVNLNNTYLFLNDATSLPYSDAGMLEGFFSVLTTESYWGQYFIESQELEMDISYTKPMPIGLQSIEPHTHISNIPNFDNYFAPKIGLKKFSSDSEFFTINLKKVEIDSKDYFRFENIDKSNHFPFVLSEGLLQMENNKAYLITPDLYLAKAIALKSFAQNAFLKEVFATTDPNLNRSAFVLSEESGFYYTKCLGIVKEVNLNGTVLSNCLELQHDYLHINCYKYNTSHQHRFENYLCGDTVFFSYWELGKGLTAIRSMRAGLTKDFIGTETTVIEPPQLPEEKQPTSLPIQTTEKKQGFFARLFSKKPE